MWLEPFYKPRKAAEPWQELLVTTTYTGLNHPLSHLISPQGIDKRVIKGQRLTEHRSNANNQAKTSPFTVQETPYQSDNKNMNSLIGN